MQYENSYQNSVLLKSHIRSSIEPIAFSHQSPQPGDNCNPCNVKIVMKSLFCWRVISEVLLNQLHSPTKVHSQETIVINAMWKYVLWKVWFVEESYQKFYWTNRILPIKSTAGRQLQSMWEEIWKVWYVFKSHMKIYSEPTAFSHALKSTAGTV